MGLDTLNVLQVVPWGVRVAADATSPGNYKITAAPTTDGLEKTHNLLLRIRLTGQPNHVGID
jgi:hypothetical protein